MVLFGDEHDYFDREQHERDWSASRYKVSSIDLSGSQVLTSAGAADGSTTYIGGVRDGRLVIRDSGTYFATRSKSQNLFRRQVNIAGNGMLNVNNQPLDLQMFGIQPPSGSPSSNTE